MSELFAALPRVLQLAVINYVCGPKRIVVAGDFNAGKSTLCDVLWKRKRDCHKQLPRYALRRIPSPIYAPTWLLEVNGAFKYLRPPYSRKVLHKASALWIVVRVYPTTNIFGTATQWYATGCYKQPQQWHLLLNIDELDLTSEHHMQIAMLQQASVARPRPASVWAHDFKTCKLEEMYRILEHTIHS